MLATAALGAALLIAGLPGTGEADPSRLKLTFGARQEYNDNIFFDAKNPESDFITTGIFALDLGYETERLQTHAVGRWEAYTYHDNSTLDDIDQDYRLSLDYRFTPRLKGGISGAYIRDNRRDREAETTGVALANEERVRYELQTDWEYLLSEITALNLAATYWEDDYQRDAAFREEFRDLEAYGLNLGLTRALRVFNRPTYGRLNLGGYHYEYETSQTDYYYLNLGFSTQLHESYTLLLDVGPRYTDSKYPTTRLEPTAVPGLFAIVAETESSRDWGGSGRLSLAYAGEKTNWEAALSREITASSGQNQAVERTELRFDWRRWFTWELRGILQLRYFINESDRDDPRLADIDEDTVVIHPQLFYRFSTDWSLRGGYRYTWEKDNENSTTTERNQVMIEMIYHYPVWD
jgi:hypothetical protein